MTGTPTPAWPFLVARGRQMGYQLLLAPDFMAAARESGTLLAQVQGEVPASAPPAIVNLVAPSSGALCVVYRTRRGMREDIGPTEGTGGPLLDRAGRPLLLAYGFVCRKAHVIDVDEADLRVAREAALATYRRFYADEDSFVPETSLSWPARSTVVPIEVDPLRPPAPRSAEPWTSQVLPSRGPATTERRSFFRVLSLVGILALLGLCATIYFGLRPRQVQVPDIVGQTQADAVQQVGAANLVPELVEVASDKPAGVVVGTDPPAGKRVDSGSKLRINLSSGSDMDR